MVRAVGCRVLSVVITLTCITPGVAQTPTPHGRLFPPQDLGLLEGPDRDAWQRPEQVMDALSVFDGAHVADLGAGGGWFTVRLARRVGPNGVVFAEDIQPQMIEAIERRVQREGLDNVATILGTPRDPRLPPNRLDAILIVDAYHELEDPVGLLQNVARALKAKGRLGIIEYKTDGGGPGPPLDERVDPEEIVRTAEASGLTLMRRETFLPYQNLLVFGRTPVTPEPSGEPSIGQVSTRSATGSATWATWTRATTAGARGYVR